MDFRGNSASCAFGQFVCAVLLYATPAAYSFSAAFIPASDHEDWVGELASLEMADGSLLHEYSALTLSGNRNGAALSVSFVPRFECKPIISFRVSKSDWLATSAEPQIEFSIDDRIVEFNALIDEYDESYLFSYHADSAQNRTLRNLLDVGSRVVASISELSAIPSASEQSDNDSGAVPEPETAQSMRVNFSLLGSRKAVLVVEQACIDHQPVPYVAR